MAPVLGICIMVASLGATAIDVWVLRPRVSTALFTGVLAAAGATLGVGALLTIDDVSTASWLLTPAVMAVLAVAHTRSLFVGAGPFRT